MTLKAREDRFLMFLFMAGFLLFDRVLQRLWIISLPAILLFLLSEKVRVYDAQIIIFIIALAVLWGIADLARGIELDHESKDRTLRDVIQEAIRNR